MRRSAITTVISVFVLGSSAGPASAVAPKFNPPNHPRWWSSTTNLPRAWQEVRSGR